MGTTDGGFRLLTSVEVTVLIFSITTYLLLFLAGRAVLKRDSPIALYAPVGLAVSYLFFIFCSLFFAKFSATVPFYAVVCFAAFGCLKRKKGLKFELALFSVSIAMLLPLIYLAVINNNPLWDDFTNWLPPARYLFEYNHLPTLDIPDVTHVTQTYPFLRAMFHAWVAKFSGTFNLNVQGVLNMLLAGSFLVWAHELKKVQFENQNNVGEVASCLPLMGLLAASLTVWILTLNTRLVLGSFADPALSLSLAGVLIYLSSSRNIESCFWNGRIDTNLFFLFLFPYFIKDAAVYFVPMLFFCFWLSKLGQSEIQSVSSVIKMARKLAIQTVHFAPLFMVMMIWNKYCNQNGLNFSIALQPIDTWNFDVVPQILKSMLSQTLGRPYLLIGLIISIFLILKNWNSNILQSKIRRTILPPIMFIIAMHGFLFIAYLGAFGESGAARATSFSRYIAPAGFLIWVALIVYWVTQHDRMINKSFKVVCAVLFISFSGLIVAKADKFVVPDTQTPLRQAAKEIQKNYSHSKSLLIVDALSSGIDYVSIRYYLGREYYTRVDGLTWRPNSMPLPELRLLMKKYDDVFIYSAPKSLMQSVQKIQGEK